MAVDGAVVKISTFENADLVVKGNMIAKLVRRLHSLKSIFTTVEESGNVYVLIHRDPSARVAVKDAVMEGDGKMLAATNLPMPQGQVGLTLVMTMSANHYLKRQNPRKCWQWCSPPENLSYRLRHWLRQLQIAVRDGLQ